MDYDTWMRWLAMVTHASPLTGSHTPHTDPLDVIAAVSK